MGKDSFYNRYIKRILDVFLSGIALVILLFPLAVIAVLVQIDVGSPFLFKQSRIGKDNKEFKLLKFRSMSDVRDAQGIYLPDEDRMTKFGAFIRRTSIDELPSLINIIKGDMSIIGPRPLPSRYLPRYTNEQKRRHEVKPGLSSPATAAGRNAQTWEHQLEGDVWYVDHVSFAVDIKSIFATIKVVVTREGQSAEDGGARGEFLGTAKAEDLRSDAEGNYMKV